MIFIVAMICVPIMLLPKPILLYLNQKKNKKKTSQNFEQLVEEVI